MAKDRLEYGQIILKLLKRDATKKKKDLRTFQFSYSLVPEQF